ncbi:MAG: hypothetical protein H7240_10820 [Glaciimonas sp.]|nr:hypothetical protein [Glaciimonas sp.]
MMTTFIVSLIVVIIAYFLMRSPHKNQDAEVVSSKQTPAVAERSLPITQMLSAESLAPLVAKVVAMTDGPSKHERAEELGQLRVRTETVVLEKHYEEKYKGYQWAIYFPASLGLDFKQLFPGIKESLWCFTIVSFGENEVELARRVESWDLGTPVIVEWEPVLKILRDEITLEIKMMAVSVGATTYVTHSNRQTQSAPA